MTEWKPCKIHKIMAGLLDAYTMTGNTKAMKILSAMTEYHYKRITKVIEEKGASHWQDCLDIEFGGMNDVMYRLYAVSRDETHLKMAQYFDKINFLEPLALNKDILAGHHANTHLAQVVGFAEGYEVLKEQKALDVVKNFFTMLSSNHSYATGGSNDKEFWFQPNILAESILNNNDSLETQEICTQYNILKIARSLFKWSGDVRLADFYERALVNGILGVSRMTNDDVHAGNHQHQHGEEDHHHRNGLTMGNMAELKDLKEDQDGDFGNHASANLDGSSSYDSAGFTHQRTFSNHSQDYWGYNVAKMPNNENATNVAGTPGVFIYLLPLGAGFSKGDSYHHWGYPEHSFWCCYGTAIEAFAKLADSIYFKSAAKGESPPKLYINQLVSSKLNWKEMGVQISAKANGFENDHGPSASASFNFTVNPPPPVAGNNDKPREDPGVQFSIKLRIPAWAKMGMTVVKVNGQEWRRCPSTPSPGSYCNLVRSWKTGDTLTISLGLSYWIKPLNDMRPQYSNLKAFMMGPHVMAGLTHDTRHLEVEGDVDTIFSEPGDEDTLVSLQAAWNSSLYVRHDKYHVYVSSITDSGDAIDATFRVASSCEAGFGGLHSHLEKAEADEKLEHIKSQAQLLGLGRKLASVGVGGFGGDSSSSLVGSDDESHHMRQQMKVGLHEHVSVLFESMNFPAFYIGTHKNDDTATVSQPTTPGGAEKEHLSPTADHDYDNYNDKDNYNANDKDQKGSFYIGSDKNDDTATVSQPSTLGGPEEEHLSPTADNDYDKDKDNDKDQSGSSSSTYNLSKPGLLGSFKLQASTLAPTRTTTPRQCPSHPPQGGTEEEHLSPTADNDYDNYKDYDKDQSFYIGTHKKGNTATVSQPSTPRGPEEEHSSPTADKAESGSSTNTDNAASEGFCTFHQFMLVAGLDGQKGTLSLESVAKPGYYLSAYK
eukprot:gene9142-16265_t